MNNFQLLIGSRIYQLLDISSNPCIRLTEEKSESNEYAKTFYLFGCITKTRISLCM